MRSNGGYPQQMVINMKTTVTTNGGNHNGLVVHSAVQSPSTSSNWISPFMEQTTVSNTRLEARIEMVRSNSSLHRDASPIPIQMVPSTSRETLVTTKSRDPSPSAVRATYRPPSPPSSPIYSFNGRDSPPDEFIQPTKLVLNVFRPPYREPRWQFPISRSMVNDSDAAGISLSKRNALLSDAVSTTTTVEVFRAPMSGESIAIPPSPYGGAPLLVRTNGDAYERWQNERKETVLDDELRMRGVQWKEGLVDGSDYAEIAGNETPIVIHNDYRPRGNSPGFQPVTHPIISNSRDDLSSSSYHPSQISPMYVVPDRKLRDNENQDNRRAHHHHHRRSKSSTRDRPRAHVNRRSVSPVPRHGSSQELVLNIGHSPIGSTLMLTSPDPNELPGDRRPASARSHEIFALYQTRDAYNRIVDQL